MPSFDCELDPRRLGLVSEPTSPAHPYPGLILHYWPSAPWTARLTSSSQSLSINMDLPFAMVGSHPYCHIRIDKPGTPDLVYVVFSFKETIEVWPTVAIAFPQWGPLADSQPLMVGGTSILFEQRENEAPLPENFRRSSKMHILDLDGEPHIKRRSVLLNHRVQIVGGNHPSTIRIRDVGLSDCEQAIVGFDECCWQIDLRQNIDESDRVKQIFVDDGMKIGRLNASYRTKGGKAQPTSSKPSNLPSQKPIRPVASKIVIAPESLDFKRENGLEDEADGITEAVTDRLVRLNRTRTLPAKVVRWSLWFLMVVAAGGVLTWIAREFAPSLGGLWQKVEHLQVVCLVSRYIYSCQTLYFL